MLETKPVTGVWSGRDVAGHLADWHQLMLDAVDDVLSGTSPRTGRIRDFDAFNADQAAVRGIESWEKSSSDLEAAWKRVNEKLDQLSQDEMQKIGTLPWGPVENIEGFFRMIAAHTRTHGEDAEAWRWRMLGVPERGE